MAVATKDNSKAKKDAGFTLVEVLCVLALLGLTAGMVVLNLPKGPSPEQSQAQMLAITFNLASRESVIDGKVRAIDVDDDRIEFFRYDGEWISERSQEFGGGLNVALDVDGEPVDLKTRSKSKKELPPLIELDATGNITPFTLSFSSGLGSYVLSPDQRGTVIVEIKQ